jgi:hypothetical protein
MDKEQIESIIRVQLTPEQNARFNFIQADFESLEELLKVQLLVSNFALPFCDSTYFDKLWINVCQSLSDGGYFIGNFFGLNDEWNTSNSKMIFHTKEQVLELFKEFNILYINEIEYDKNTAMGKMKHWHVIEVVAKHK